MKVAIIVPTIRPEQYTKFLEAWQPLFEKYNVMLFTVHDGKKPTVEMKDYFTDVTTTMSIKDIMGEYQDTIFNFNSGVRNVGFAAAYTFFRPDMYMTLDDDEVPIGDPIKDHWDALSMKVPVSWMKVGSEYTRGFPYGIRDEAQVVLSHGVWEGFADWDAPTQLVDGNKEIDFYKGPIPKGVYYPMCIMNIAFREEALPYIYQPPQGEKAGIWRFDDIWSGVLSKREIDKNGWAVVTGYSRTLHQRASNVWKNLKYESTGLELNETFWQGDEKDPFFKLYRNKLQRWQEFLKKNK